MMNFKELNYTLFRIAMGVNMAIHGFVRIFGDYDFFINKMLKLFQDTIVPQVMVSFIANLISPVELFFGLLLIIGFKTKASLLILNINMLILVSGVCLIQNWTLAGLQMSYILFLFFIGNYIELNKFSIDYYMKKRLN